MLDIQKLRPLNFNMVVGNHKNIELLKNALKHGFPEFTILTGQEGIGKTTVSKILAKHLVCPNRHNGIACENCDTCQEVNLRVIQNNLDTSNVVTFRMSDEGGKRAARKIEEFIRTIPMGGGNKVIILEECQGMLREAQDLLLPILEYIPDDTKIIACTTNEKALQRTFLSRASIYKFIVPQRKETAELLSLVCQRNNIQIVGTTVIPRIVEYSGNKPRTSLRTLQKLSSQGTEITLQLVNDFLNLVSEEYYLEYLNILRGDMGLVLDFIDRLEKDEVSLTDFVKGLNDFMVKLITLRYRTVYLPESVIAKAKKLLTILDENDLLKIQSICSEEIPKIDSDEFAKSQLIAMSFKIMNRNVEDLLATPIKTQVQVDKEKELAMKRHMERKKKQDNANVGSMDLSNNLNALLEGMNASVIQQTTPQLKTENEE